MTTIDTTNPLRNAVFVAARNESKSTQAVIDAIKACQLDWSKPDQVDPIAAAYKTGRISAALDCAEDVAQGILSLKPFKDGLSADNRRTFGQHMACRAAISAWSHIRGLAGAPSAQTGKDRGARAPEGEPEVAKLPANMVTLTRAQSANDVQAFALRIADVVKRYLDMNAGIAGGMTAGTLRDFVVDIPEAVKLDNAEPTLKAA
jgi:hypothetical protein